MTRAWWAWNDKHQARWTAIRARGRARFVLVNGILGWGLPMFLFMAVCPKLFSFPFPPRPGEYYWLWTSALWVVAGAIFGTGTWYFSERSYRRHESKAL